MGGTQIVSMRSHAPTCRLERAGKQEMKGFTVCLTGPQIVSYTDGRPQTNTCAILLGQYGVPDLRSVVNLDTAMVDS